MEKEIRRLVSTSPSASHDLSAAATEAMAICHPLVASFSVSLSFSLYLSPPLSASN